MYIGVPRLKLQTFYIQQFLFGMYIEHANMQFLSMVTKISVNQKTQHENHL